MRRPVIAVVSAVLAVFAAASAVFAQQIVEGRVASAKLTACDPKPGGCEGSLVLEPKGAGSGPVTIKVVRARRSPRAASIFSSREPTDGRSRSPTSRTGARRSRSPSR